MKRRDFLVGSASVLSAVVPVLARSQTIPCPPPDVSIDGQGAVATACKPTLLTDAARALSPGQSTTSLGDAGLDSAALYTIQWANRFHVDVVHGRAHLIGKNASSQGAERSNCVYDMATNRWTQAIFDGGGLGHVYESIAYDPARGEIYTGQWSGGDTLKRWTYGNTLSTWTNPATSGFGAYINSDTQPTLCWHPNLFGSGDGGVLALKNSGTGTTSVVAWRRSNNQWYTVPGTSATGMSGTYLSNGAIEYIAGGDFCIASSAPSKGGKTFRINAGSGGTLANAVQISNVPFDCGYTGSGNIGILIDDPAGSASAYILEKGGSNRVWKYSGGNWALKSYKHPFPAGSTTTEPNWMVATCRTLGVFWSKHNRTTTPSRLWKPND